jgi:NADPH2:quinone reductase
MSDIPTVGLQLRSLVKSTGVLELSLQDTEVQAPGPNEVLVRVEASPVNPSDLGMVLGMADVTTAEQAGTAERPVLTAQIPQGLMKAVAGRVDQSLPPGNEGAGVVIAAGDEAQDLMGKMVACLGGAMYGQYRTLKSHQCLVMNEGVTAQEAASCFVNPLTALGMVETMRLEGFEALIHTAAASNLGQMLQKICIADGVSLVNIVRKPEQEALLREIGATHVCDSSKASFAADLKEAIAETSAYLAFDATGGGDLANDILVAMELAASAAGGEYARYGSDQNKQVYIYGGLERSPTVLKRAYGMQWSIGGWLLTPFLRDIGRERADELRQRVADEVKTTFASNYTAEVSLAGALTTDSLQTYAKQATGQKYLINPNMGL